MLPLRHGWTLAALLGAATACVSHPPDLPEAETIAASETGDDRALPDPDSGGAWETTGDIEDDSSGSESGAQVPPPAEPPIANECDTFAQDCPLGEKCMPVSVEGSQTWNATQCRPLADNPAQIGDACTVQGGAEGAASGFDDCDVGAMCWGVQPKGGGGSCVALCAGSEAEPECSSPDEACVTDGVGALAACLPTCSPIDPAACGAGRGCYFVGELFACIPTSASVGQAGDPCEAVNGCAPGSMCIGADAVPGCAGAVGCCSDWCDVGNGMCPAPQQCVPMFDMDPDPVWASIGVCAAL